MKIKLLAVNIRKNNSKHYWNYVQKNYIFHGSMYQQIDGVTMANPLGPVLSNLEENLIPNFNGKLKYWRSPLGPKRVN